MAASEANGKRRIMNAKRIRQLAESTISIGDLEIVLLPHDLYTRNIYALLQDVVVWRIKNHWQEECAYVAIRKSGQVLWANSWHGVLCKVDPSTGAIQETEFTR